MIFKDMRSQELRIGNWVKINDQLFKEYRDSVYESYTTNEFKIRGWNDGSGREGCRQIAFYTIRESNFDGKIHSGVYDIDIDPIQLTDEWFEKFGFYRDGEYWCKGINDYKYCFKYRDWAENWAFYQEFTDSPDDRDDGVKYPISFDIKYVHQLQNLWFALLFEELTIKE